MGLVGAAREPVTAAAAVVLVDTAEAEAGLEGLARVDVGKAEAKAETEAGVAEAMAVLVSVTAKEEVAAVVRPAVVQEVAWVGEGALVGAGGYVDATPLQRRATAARAYPPR